MPTMPNTRSNELSSIIDNKFEEFKTSFLINLKAELIKEIDAYVEESIFKSIDNYMDEKKNVQSDDELNKSILEIQKHVKNLQLRMSFVELENKWLKKENNALSEEVDALQQYGRRRNLRIYGIPTRSKETEEDVCTEVKKIIDEAGMNIPHEAIDRAHRIGAVITKDDGFNVQPIIVRFTGFRNRTKFYKARKSIKRKVGVSLDLTKKRLSMLNDARTLITDCEEINFCYADINCRLRAFTKDGKHVAFDSIDELNTLIGSLQSE